MNARVRGAGSRTSGPAPRARRAPPARPGPSRGGRRRVRALLAPGLALLLATLAASTLSGCGGDAPRATPPGSFAAAADLRGQTITVGGKEFAEQRVLCAMTIALLQSAGATAVDRCDTRGSANVRADLTSGQIDLYWEYTGTAWSTYLGQETRLSDSATLYRAVRDADVGNHVRWLAPTPFDDTYAIGVRADTGARLGVHTLSDLAALAARDPGDASLCVDQEFTGREDGLQGLLRTYGLVIADGRLTTRDEDDIYPAVATGTPCAFGEVFATDGRLDALDIVPLVDDKGYFLPYNAAPTVRDDVLDRAPALAALGTVVSPLLTTPVMRDLDRQVSLGGRPPADVARAFLHDHGLIG